MPSLLLPHADIKAWLDRLGTDGELHAPLRGRDGAVRFDVVQQGVIPDLQALRSLLPPKKYLLPPNDTVLRYTQADGYHLPLQATTRLILLGLHPCDLAAIAYLDRQFFGDQPDPIYAARRQRLTLIGSSCRPDAYCSCHLSPSPLPAACDLFLHQTATGFLLMPETPRGSAICQATADLLRDYEPKPPPSPRDHFGVAMPPPPQTELDPRLPDWQELANHCLGCGACSLACPTCSCFELLEFGGLDGRTAERLLRWDNCLFKGHAEVAGGHSFQKDRAQRFRYRYRHKYRGYGPLQGVPSCVGCGRCRVQCPAGLDLRPLAERLEKGAP